MLVAFSLGFQTGGWNACASYCNSVSQANGCFVVRAVDVAAIDECCHPIYLLSRISFSRAEDV